MSRKNDRVRVDEPLLDVGAELARWGYRHGSDSFHGEWKARNAWNIPGPVYVGDDDSCGTGPDAAPNNVWLPTDNEYVSDPGGEFVFRQPASMFELRQIVIASETNAMDAYGADGDAHWTAQDVHEWWRTMSESVAAARRRVEDFDAGVRAWAGERRSGMPPGKWPSAGLRRWLNYMESGAEPYLRRYVAYLDEGDHRAALNADIAKLPSL